MNVSEKRLSVLAADSPEAFLRLTGVMARKGFRLRGMSLAKTMRPGVVRYTLVFPGDDGAAERAVLNLRKVVDVLRVEDVSGEAFRERWVALIRCACRACDVPETLPLRVLEEDADSVLFEASGDRETVESCISAMASFGIGDVIRGGPFVMPLAPGTEPPV